MGNYASCTLANPGPLRTKSSAARVIFPSGELRTFREPIKAAELMLEAPSSSFLVNARSLHMGRRFSPLNADEDLEPANLYLVLPMKRLNSVATAADMAVLFMAASNSAAKRRLTAGKVGVLPQDQENKDNTPPEGRAAAVGETRSSVEEVDGFSGESMAAEFRRRAGSCRSRKPGLETIREETTVA